MCLVQDHTVDWQIINIYSQPTKSFSSAVNWFANVGWHQWSASSLANVSWCPAWCQPWSNIVTASGWSSADNTSWEQGCRLYQLNIDQDPLNLCHELLGHCHWLLLSTLSSYQLPQNVILRFNAGPYLLTSCRIVINTRRPLTRMDGILLTFCLKL